MDQQEPRKNPVVARKAKQRLLFIAILVIAAIWLIGGGIWGTLWSKVDRLWFSY
jgi:hypothetical protein